MRLFGSWKLETPLEAACGSDLGLPGQQPSPTGQHGCKALNDIIAHKEELCSPDQCDWHARRQVVQEIWFTVYDQCCIHDLGCPEVPEVREEQPGLCLISKGLTSTSSTPPPALSQDIG